MKPLLDELRDIARARKKTVSQVPLEFNRCVPGYILGVMQCSLAVIWRCKLSGLQLGLAIELIKFQFYYVHR